MRGIGRIPVAALCLLSATFLFTISARADDIVLVDVDGLTYTSAAPCSVCTETINISFEFDDTLIPVHSPTPNVPAGVVPGTTMVDASGFLGQLTMGSGNGDGLGLGYSEQGYVPFFNSACVQPSCDELDLEATGPLLGPFFTPGANTYMYFYSCASLACKTAYPDAQGTGYVKPSNPGTITITAVPEPSTLLLFGTGLLGLAGTVKRKVFS